MRLATELTVDAPLERAWPALLELGGAVRLDLGGEYAGTARLDDADEDEHTAGFHIQARETAGHGLAAATIAARLSEADGGTRVAVDTDLRLTGASSRPGEEELQRMADELLGRVAGSLGQEPATGAPEPADRSVADLARELLATAEERPRKRESPTLKGSDPSVLAVRVAERSLLVVLGALIGLVLGRLLWRSR